MTPADMRSMERFAFLFNSVVALRHCWVWIETEKVETRYEFLFTFHAVPLDGKNILRDRAATLEANDLADHKNPVRCLRDFVRGPLLDLDAEFREIERTLMIYQGNDNYWRL